MNYFVKTKRDYPHNLKNSSAIAMLYYEWPTTVGYNAWVATYYRLWK